MLLVDVVYKGRIIRMGLNFAYVNMILTNISGTRINFQYLALTYILQYSLVVCGKENRMDLFHGGGKRPVC